MSDRNPRRTAEVTSSQNLRGTWAASRNNVRILGSSPQRSAPRRGVLPRPLTDGAGIRCTELSTSGVCDDCTLHCGLHSSFGCQQPRPSCLAASGVWPEDRRPPDAQQRQEAGSRLRGEGPSWRPEHVPELRQPHRDRPGRWDSFFTRSRCLHSSPQPRLREGVSEGGALLPMLIWVQPQGR